ncbi:uncharacterized protein LOC126298049 [Schistocerca gregaria]|uniref:uncharacterized protein LOC126298049 n=1 Tax=Schistocerca gregaria TaxID=7010 RepID=UPI00211EE56D|nr:uncharacterized protein LOC126298049 [Schistocerca gregaria]
MAVAPVLLAVAVALLAATDSVAVPPHRPPVNAYTTSPLFDDLMQPLCSESSTDDACYGCFARYSRMKQTPDAYEELKKCTTRYLNGTAYAECQALVGDAKVLEGGLSPVYCDFEKCVRKRDMLQLVDACAKQNDNSKTEAEKYIQTTSCLAEELKRRNFLSGPRYPGGFTTPKSYAVYVTEAGELRVMSTYWGNDQYSCEPWHSPLGSPGAPAGGSVGAF